MVRRGARASLAGQIARDIRCLGAIITATWARARGGNCPMPCSGVVWLSRAGPVCRQMNDYAKTREQLLTELAALRRRIAELEGSRAQPEGIEDLLQRGEPPARLLLEAVQDIVFVWDLRVGAAAYVSPVCERVLGWTADELIGVEPPRGGELLHPDDRERAMQVGARLDRGAEDAEQEELRIRHKDGHYVWLSVRRAAIPDSSGRMIAMVGTARDVTSAKQTEAALRDSEERLRTTFEAARNVAFVTTDLAGPEARILDFSPGAENIFGYSREEAVGRPLAILHPPDQVKNFAAVTERMRRSGKSAAAELDLARKSGERFPAILTTFPILDDAGNMDKVLGVSIDITDRKRFEEALRESEERYRTLVENMDLGVSLIDRDHRIVMTNEWHARTFGKSPEEFVGKLCYEEFEKRDAVCLHCPGTRAMATGDTHEVETEGVRDDGTRLPVRIKAFPVYSGDGDVAGFIEVVEDISERERSERALREAELRYQALFENAPVGIGVASRDGKVLATNEAGCRITGYSVQELRAVNIRDTYMEPTYRDGVLRQLDRDGMIRNLEVRLKRKDGTPYVARLTITALRLGDEDVLLTTMEDVTEQKRAEAELRDHQERLRSLASQLSLAEEQERRRIASGLHDSVGQLLAIAGMRLGVLQQKPYSADFARRLQDICKLIDQASHTMQSLIFELSPPVLYELGLGAAVELLAEQMREQHSLEVVVNSHGDSASMTNDVRSLLFKAVRELLMNVVKHAKTGKAEVRIRSKKGAVLVEVADNGVGFDVERLDPRRNRAGGFGLFSVRERLEHLGGTLTIDSSPGDGTVVTATLPMAEGANS